MHRQRYRLFIDESGDHAYKLLDDPAHRYLALLGVWFRWPEQYRIFKNDLDRLKTKLFDHSPDDPVVLHRSKIINLRGAFGRLRDADNRSEFEEGVLRVIERAEFAMICVIIDKKAHLGRYVSPFHPYHYALTALVDRYCWWLNFKNSTGDVMTEARGKREDAQLISAYDRLYESGTLITKPQIHQRVLTSRSVKVVSKKDDEAGIQLADLLAHPVKQALLIAKGLIGDTGPVFGKRIFEAAKPKFNKNEYSGRVRNYGVVWL